MNYIDQLKANISDLTQKTLSDEFGWVRENQTTYYCEVEREQDNSENPSTLSFLISIQQVRNSSVGISPKDLYEAANQTLGEMAAEMSTFRYILQIKDLNLNRIALKADTLDDVYGSQMYVHLAQLYKAVREQVSSQSLDAFNTVLGN